MSDLPEIPRGAPRHWLEYVSTFVAVVISVVSLWVAIGSESANRQMVAASSWPFLQVDTSNSDAQNKPVLTFAVTNAGVGPAKVKSFEVFWKGRPYRHSAKLMHDCCGYQYPTQSPSTMGDAAFLDMITTGHLTKRVIRAGESFPFLTIARNTQNASVWSKIDDARQSGLRYRVCYCSVFDECWIDQADFNGDTGPQRIDTCPVPKVPYIE